MSIRPEDLRIESWPPDPGGMRVYMPRGVRIVHLPSGIAVACEKEGSQHRNKDAALKMLEACLKIKDQP